MVEALMKSMVVTLSDDKCVGSSLGDDEAENVVDVPDDEPLPHMEWGVPASVVNHILEHHREEVGSVAEYRHQVLERALAEWPHAITPQVLRTRLAAFKEQLCDANYDLGICACCAREKRRCKLSVVEFPPVTSSTAPSWLSWSDEEWILYRKKWFDQVDNLLNVERYLQEVFQADERVRVADVALDSARNSTLSCDEEGYVSEAAALSWHTRVKQWRENMRRDLRDDSVFAPGKRDAYWLL